MRATLIVVAFFLGYLLLDWISYIHPMKAFNITPWNPQPALVIALLMVAGQRLLPVVFAAIVAADLIIRAGTAPLLSAVLVSAVLTFGYAAIAHALSSVCAIAPKLQTRRDMIRLIGVVTAGTLGTGLLYVGALLASGVVAREDYVEAVLRFWIGDSVGVLVTLPLVLMILDAERRADIKKMLRRKETLVQGAAIGAILWVVFGQTAAEQFKFFYLLFLPLIWVAARSGLVGAAVAVAVIQSGVILAVQIAGHQTLTVFELQALLMALTITGFFLGITVEERQRAALELRESLRLAAAGEMAAALAHELNQPLTALSGYAKASELLVGSPTSNRQQLVETLHKLVGEAKRAAEVVRRLRDFFRTGATQLQRTSLPDLVGETLDRLRAGAQAKGLSIQCQVAGPIPDLLIDPMQIEVVVRNLVSNAIDAVVASATGPKEVVVKIEPDVTGDVRVTVSDSGPGIAPERTAQLFEPFETTKATGMGIGLAISRAIVEAHGGRLWAEPADHGVLCFTLPMREAGDE